ncbi:MAG: hypothetical protein ACE5GJ_14590 [Gemmatimonadota bacterium]
MNRSSYLRSSYLRTLPALIPCLALILGTGLASPRPAAAQTGDAVLGGFLGAGGGAFVTAGLIAGDALRGRYILNPGDLGWRMAPVPLGAAVGAFMGARNGRRLHSSLAWGTGGWVLGMAGGALAGALLEGSEEAVWTGVLVGGAVGLVAGSVAGALAWSGDGGVDPTLALQVAAPW